MSLFVRSFLSFVLQYNHERPHRFQTHICLPDSGREITMYYERLLRGIAATKGLPRGCRLHRRRGILDSNRFGSVSGMGIAELEFAARDRLFVNRVSHRASPRL